MTVLWTEAIRQVPAQRCTCGRLWNAVIRSYLKFLSQAAALFLGLTAIACLVPNLPDWAGLKYCFFLSIAFFVIRSAHKWWSQEKWEKRHKAYSIGLCEKDYLAWQQKFFDTLYSGLEIATLMG